MAWRRSLEPYGRPLFFAASRLLRGMTLGVRAVVTDTHGRVLLVEHTYLSGWWLPGGGVDRGETGEQAVMRELREETGVHAESRPRLLSIHSNERFFRGDHVLVYRIGRWSQHERSSRHEIARTGFFPLDALPPDTTGPTRRRLEEALGGAPPDPFW